MSSDPNVWSGKEVYKLLNLLRQEQQLAADVLETLPLGIAVFASNFEAFSTNREFSETLRWEGETEHSIGLRQELREAVANALAARQPQRIVLHTARGSQLEISVLPVRRSDEHVILMLNAPAARAATTPAPSGLSAAPEAREEVMAALERLSGQVAHRFNNLLTIVISYADMIVKRFGSVESLREDVTQILEAGNAASEVTSQLLVFSRGRPTETSLVNASALLRDFRAMLQGIAGERVRLVIDPDPALAPVLISPSDMETVLLNLVANARDAISGEGEISVVTRRITPARPVDAALLDRARLEAGDYSSLSVSDTGTGIHPEALPYIFEPFYSTKPGSAGMGLAVVYGMVKRAGGAVVVDSETGRGSTFTVLLPEAHAAATGS